MSLAKILQGLDVGQEIALPDDWDKVSPSHTERHVGTLNSRPPRGLTGRHFSGCRVTLSLRHVGREIAIPEPFLLIQRTR